MGRENKSYQDLQEIYKAFEDQLAGIASASTPSAGSSATATARMVALDQSYDALYQAQQKIVLAVGSRYMYSNEMYQLQQMDAQKLVLEKVVLFDSQAAVLQVETASCHKHLKPTKNSTPQLLDGTTADAHLPPKSCQEAVKASKVFLGLLEASQQLQPKSLFKAVGLEVVGRRAYSLQKIGAGQLTLLPVTDSASQIHFKKPGSKHGQAVFEGQTVYISPCKAFKMATAEAASSGSSAPFWWIPGTEEPNLVWKEKQHGGLKIQCLCNPKVIEEHELLTMPCPSDQAKSSTEAILQPKAAPKSKASRPTEPTVKAQPAKKKARK